MKKLCTILAALTLAVLCIVLLPAEAKAASESDLTFTLSSDGESYYVYDCNNSASGDLIIPATYNGKPVTTIGPYAFEDCSKLTSITIPDSVTDIGFAAFNNCSRLTSVTIGNGVFSIGESAFRSCSKLASITIPDSVISIGNYAFISCDALSNVIIGDGVISIGDGAFSYCNSLASISIPNGVTSIGATAFRNCSSLISVTLGNGVTSIGDYAFELCDALSGVVIGDGVISIGNGAFSYCTALTNVAIPDSVTSIGNGAFSYCNKLTSITISDGVTSIGLGAFSGCSSLRYTIYDNAKYLGNGANPYVALVDKNSTSFRSCNIHKDTKVIADHAFINCIDLTNITIPNSVTSIGSLAFSNCSSLTRVIYCGTEEQWNAINVGSHNDQLISAERSYHAFDNDQDADCNICGAVKNIHNLVDGLCTICRNHGTCGENLTWELDDEGTLTISGTGAMANNKPWGEVNSSIENVVINEGVTSISNDAFSRCSSLKSVTIDNSVTSIGEYAFWLCENLTSITLPDRLSNIGNWAFAGCYRLQNITIPDSVISIGYYAFSDCGLRSIELPNNVTHIGSHTFDWCSGLTNIVIPDSVTSIGNSAFENCDSLRNVIYCGTEEQWNTINIGESNTCLTDAQRNYHLYDNEDDADCNICDCKRILKADDLGFLQVPSLSLQDYIGVQMLIRNADVAKYDEVYVIAVQEGPDGPVKTKLEGIPFYGVYQVFDHQVLSWSMTEQVTLTLYGVIDGVVYIGSSVTESVESLAMNMLKTSTDTVKNRVLVDMLNYGAAVQTAFKHNADNLPNTQLGNYAALGTSTTPSMTASSTGSGSGSIKASQVSISMQAKVELQILFMTKIDTYTPKATLNGSDVAVTVDNETYAAYGWTIVKIAAGAANLRDYYEFALYDANGNAVSPVYQLTVEAYAKNQLGGAYKDVAVAMMRYGDSVAAYANK